MTLNALGIVNTREQLDLDSCQRNTAKEISVSKSDVWYETYLITYHSELPIGLEAVRGSSQKIGIELCTSVISLDRWYINHQ